jgi:hypothetical protein
MLDRHHATSEQPDGVFCVYARAWPGARVP